MNTKNKTTEQLAGELAQHLLNMPLGLAPQIMQTMLGGYLEAVRCENIPAGIFVRGKENLRNGSVRVHCKDDFFIIPYFDKDVLKAITQLHQLHDFSTMEKMKVLELLQNRVTTNG